MSNAAYRERVTFIRGSTGIVGVLRAVVRKGFSPFVLYQKSYLLRAELPVDLAEEPAFTSQGVKYELLNKRQTAEALMPGGCEIQHTLDRFMFTRNRIGLQLSVIKVRGTIVGCCLFERDVIGINGTVWSSPEPSYFVHFIAIHENYRGKGLMGRLLLFTESVLLKQGARSRLCLVQSHNRASLKAFLSSGSVKVGSIRVVKFLRKKTLIACDANVKGYLSGANH